MAYKLFDPSGPDGAVDDGPNTIAILTDNDNALRDAIIAGVGFFFWQYTPVGGTPDQPDEALYQSAAERIKVELTWGVGGGADGNVTQAIYSYSNDSGNNYDVISTQTISYDVNGNVTGVTWA